MADVMTLEAVAVERPQVHKYLVMLAVMSATIMEILDTSVVNVSLPHIAGSLSSTISEATWVITSYLVANAVVLPITGWLSNYVGRRRLLLGLVTGFTLSSVLCGIAPSLPLLVFFRIMQGLTGGGLQPISQAVLLETFPKEERTRAMAIWGIGVVCAPIIAPTLGGWLTDTYSWRWVFYINLPIGICSLFMISRYVFDPSYIKRMSNIIDVWGIGMLAVGVGSFQIMMDKGQQLDWFASPLIVTLAIVAGIVLPAFIIRELRAKDPIVRFRLFKDRNYALGVTTLSTMLFAMYGSLVLIPLFMQEVLGWSALQTGYWTSPRGMGALLCMILMMGSWFKRFDMRWPVTAGLLGTAVVFFIYSGMTLNSGQWDLVVPQFCQGFAISLAFIPLTPLMVSSIAPNEMSYATSLYGAVRNMGASLGISISTTLLERRAQYHENMLASHIVPNQETWKVSSALRSYFMQHGFSGHQAYLQSLKVLNNEVVRQANLLSFLDIFRWLALLLIPLIVLVWLMKPAGKKIPATVRIE